MAQQIRSIKDYNGIPMPSTTSVDKWVEETNWIIRSNQPPARLQKFMMIDNKVVETKEITVHSFKVGDAEDPDLYAAQPLWDWQVSEKGMWVMENAMKPPEWHRAVDLIGYGYQYVIRATLATPKLTEYYLRFGKTTI
jgi:hypothetical protein